MIPGLKETEMIRYLQMNLKGERKYEGGMYNGNTGDRNGKHDGF